MNVLVSALRTASPTLKFRRVLGPAFTLRLNNGMSETALIEAARSQQVRLYGLSRYYSAPLPEDDAADGTLLIGFATLKIGDIPDAVARLNKAWA